MPSLNVDRQGNLAIGYSISGALQSPLFPSIDYAGRLAADPPNWLGQGDARMWMGAGSQTHAGGRSGDYSAMFVDPSDGCTFWYTNEYYPVTAVSACSTRIGIFKFTSCTGPTPTPTPPPHPTPP